MLYYNPDILGSDAAIENGRFRPTHENGVKN